MFLDERTGKGIEITSIVYGVEVNYSTIQFLALNKLREKVDGRRDCAWKTNNLIFDMEKV